jgi:hypothetical protein
MPKLVEIVWDDSCSVDGWTDLAYWDIPIHHITTVGFLVKETETHIAVAGSYRERTEEDGPEVCCIMCIPKATILSRTEI